MSRRSSNRAMSGRKRRDETDSKEDAIELDSCSDSSVESDDRPQTSNKSQKQEIKARRLSNGSGEVRTSPRKLSGLRKEDGIDGGSPMKGANDGEEMSRRTRRLALGLARPSDSSGTSSTHRAKAIIYKGAVKHKVLVNAVVGHRRCKKVMTEAGEYRFAIRCLAKWKQATDGRKFAQEGEHEFEVDEEQFKIAVGEDVSKSVWLFQEELRNCGRLIEEFEKNWERESKMAEAKEKKEEEERKKELARLEEKNRRIRKDLIAKGYCKPAAPSRSSSSDLFYSSDEEVNRAPLSVPRNDEDSDEAEERKLRTKVIRGMKSREEERLVRARLRMIFGTKAEEDAFVGEPTKEYLEERAFLLFEHRQRQIGSIKKLPQNAEQFRAFFDAHWKPTYIECAKEEWNERKNLILGRRAKFDRAARLGLDKEDELGNFFKVVYDEDNEDGYKEYEDEGLNRLYGGRQDKKLEEYYNNGSARYDEFGRGVEEEVAREDEPMQVDVVETSGGRRRGRPARQMQPPSQADDDDDDIEILGEQPVSKFVYQLHVSQQIARNKERRRVRAEKAGEMDESRDERPGPSKRN